MGGHGLAGETIKAEGFLNDPNHLPNSLSVDLLENINYSTQTTIMVKVLLTGTSSCVELLDHYHVIVLINSHRR